MSNLLFPTDTTGVTPASGDIILIADVSDSNNPKDCTLAELPVSTATQTALNAKQDTLVSATNIKTINSTSLLGSGNITTGDVVGPASATDNAIVRFDTTTGKLIQNSGVSISDGNSVSGIATLGAQTINASSQINANYDAVDSIISTGGITFAGGTYRQINDGGSNELIKFPTTSVAGAINEFTITNAATGTGPTISATGGDTNIDFNISPKGSGVLKVGGSTISGTNTGNQTIANTSDATSHTVTLSASGGSVQLIEGSNITLTTGGTGSAGTVTIASTASGTGDVVGPASATDNAIVRYDTTTGKLLQNSGVTIGDTNIVSGISTLNTQALNASSQIGANYDAVDSILLTGGLTFAGGTYCRINDGSSNELIKFPTTPVASAVNEFTITNAATGTGPTISATGGDTNIDFNIVSKGSGIVKSNGVEVVTLTGSQTLTNKTLTSPTLTTPVLGIPTSGTLTNCTFPTLNQNTTGYASALKSATTTVDVSAAAAPTSGQVLTATAGTTATWQTPSSSTTGYTTTATAGGTTTLTSSSTYYQYFTGTLGQTVTLPVTSTLTTGFSFYIVNKSTGILDINSSGANNIVSIASGASCLLTCILTSGTTSASWNFKYDGLTTATKLAGTADTTMTFPTTNATIARTDSAQTFTGTQTFSSTIVGSVNGNAATVTTNANLTGHITSTGNAAVLGSFTKAQLNTAISDGDAMYLDSTDTITAVKTFSSAPVFNALPTGTAVASAATASTIATRDANGNMLADNFIEGFRTQATAAGTTTLVVGDTYTQEFTGVTTQTCVLPTTGIVAGQQFNIINNSTGLVTVQSSGANTILIMGAQTTAIFTALVATPTTAANWDVSYQGANVASGKVLTSSNTLTLAGTDGTTMTFPSTSATIARTDAANTFTGVQTMTSPSFTTPVLGTPTSGTLTNCTGYQEIKLATILPSTATDGATVTFDLSINNKHQVTIAGNRTLALSNTTNIPVFSINIKQDATGSRTVTWFSGISWVGGTVPTLTTTASKTDSFGFQQISAGVYLGFIIGQNI